MFLVPALIVQFPWEVWQWMALASPFPGLAGKPSFNLIEHNSYVRYLTVGRPAWIYLTLTPRIVWTLIPSFLLFALLWKEGSQAAWTILDNLDSCGAPVSGYVGIPGVLQGLAVYHPDHSG